MCFSTYSHLIMVKRSCPFVDDLNPQLKIHVREKEIANGVGRENLMQHVYDRTKDLLFLGARKVSQSIHTSESNALPSGSMLDVVLPKSSCAINSMKQLQLTRHGQLNMSSDVSVSPIPMLPCSICSRWNQSEMKLCSFCDKPMCPPCTLACMKCLEFICSSCSFNVYNSSEDNICRNCC